jgi:hypothetical protein
LQRYEKITNTDRAHPHESAQITIFRDEELVETEKGQAGNVPTCPFLSFSFGDLPQ